MRLLRLAVLYTALALGANAAAAGPAALEALRQGEMRKLVVHAEPRPMPPATFLDAGDGAHPLEGWRGRIVVLNFWATWCAPCRDEMPALDALEAAMGGPDIAVVPVATGRNAVAGILRFYEEAGLRHLPVLRDPGQELARAVGVMGLPVTLLLDREGREVARLTGHADWNAPEARALLAALAAEGR